MEEWWHGCCCVNKWFRCVVVNVANNNVAVANVVCVVIANCDVAVVDGGGLRKLWQWCGVEC